MRYQGRVVEWNEERGFGFVQPNGGGNKLFAHISQFPPGQPRPQPNELVNYEIGTDAKGKSAAQAVRYVNRADSPVSRPASSRPRRSERAAPRLAQWLISGAIVLALGGLAWSKLQPSAPLAADVEQADVLAEISPAANSRFSCDGRQHCSEMNSCEEAQYFLNHCPDPKMDGDGDGEPCELGPC